MTTLDVDLELGTTVSGIHGVTNILVHTLTIGETTNVELWIGVILGNDDNVISPGAAA